MTFPTLALICLVALLGPLFSLPRHLGMPVVIGELVVGIVLGQTGLRVLDTRNPTFEFLADVGFALVMFIAGTHVPLRNQALLRGLRVGAFRAAGVGALAVPAGLAIASAFHTGHGALYAVVLASSSASLVMPVLASTPITSDAGLELLPQLAIADAACIVALPLAVEPSHAGRSALGAVAVIAAGVACYAFFRWVITSGRQRRVHELSEDRGLAIELRVVLVLLFGLAALAVTTHVSIMLAGFTLGLAMSAAGEPHRVANQTFALSEGLFAPIFYVWLGASLNLRSLRDHPSAILLGITLGLAALAVHALMAIVRQPVALALSTAAQLGVPVGAVKLGTDLGLFHPGEGTALLLGALITIVVLTAVASRLSALVRSPEPGPAP